MKIKIQTNKKTLWTYRILSILLFLGILGIFYIALNNQDTIFLGIMLPLSVILILLVILVLISYFAIPIYREIIIKPRKLIIFYTKKRIPKVIFYNEIEFYWKQNSIEKFFNSCTLKITLNKKFKGRRVFLIQFIKNYKDIQNKIA